MEIERDVLVVMLNHMTMNQEYYQIVITHIKPYRWSARFINSFKTEIK